MELKEKHSLQFELWEECNSRCKFCYLGHNNICTPDHLKIKALDDALLFLNNKEKIADYNTLSYIGGEFFQGQMQNQIVKDKFFKLMYKTAELQISGQIKEVWIMCTLTIGNQEDLYTSLEILKNEYLKVNKPELINQIWIVTSYDTIGRFHTQKMLDTWNYHMKHIHELYPLIHFNTSTILTQDLIMKYLKDEFSFNEFMKKYNTSMFFKQPSPGPIEQYQIKARLNTAEGRKEAKQVMEEMIPGFFPKREDFLQFLIKFKDDCPHLYNKLFNIQYRADDLYRNYNDDKEGHRMQYNHRQKDAINEVPKDAPVELNPVNNCGHLLDYAAYIDSDECMICDREFIRNQF